MSVVLTTRVTTKYLKGLVPLTSMASICSVTFMEPSSAPMLDPILPAQMSAVITGPISRTTEMATMSGNMLSAPKRSKRGPALHGKHQPHDERGNGHQRQGPVAVDEGLPQQFLPFVAWTEHLAERSAR
jgi:hypothetical protein